MALAIGDIDRDSHLDALVGDPTFNTVRFMKGNGMGALTLVSSPAAGLYPRSIAIGDLNHDGWPDFVTANPGTLHCCHTVTAAVATGGGDFAAPTSTAGWRYMTAVALGDVDEDGLLDAIVTAEENYVALHRGNGDGTFQPPVVLTATSFSPSIYDVELADLNQDGHLDLIMGGWPITAVVMLGHGDGTFDPEVPVVSGTSGTSLSVVAADFDLDGHLDIATCFGDSVAIALGKGDGTFAETVFVPCTDRVYAVEAADMNLDGKPDLIATYGSTVAVFLNNGPVAVKAQRPDLHLELAGLRPNPAPTDLHCAFTLASDAAATLELLDLSGRRVRVQEVGSLGPGPHVITFTRDTEIRAGVYWLRLRQDTEIRVARAVVLN
jgi:hypothetical protein